MADIKSLTLERALERIINLKLEPYSRLSLPLLQAQLAEYYKLTPRHEYGKGYPIETEYNLFSSYAKESYGFDDLVSIYERAIRGSRYGAVLKYLDPSYYINAGAFLIYEWKIRLPVDFIYFYDTAFYEPLGGFILRYDEDFKVFADINTTPMNFFIYCDDAYLADDIDLMEYYCIIVGIILLEDYDKIIELSKDIKGAHLCRDWKDALLLVACNKLDSTQKRFLNSLEERYYNVYVQFRDEFNIVHVEKDLGLTLKILYEDLITKSGDLVYYSRYQINKVMGIEDVSGYGWLRDKTPREYNFVLIPIIKNEDQFAISTNTKLCKSKKDYYYEDYDNFVFIYGSRLDGKCYSVEDLMGAFIVNDPEDYSFRHPENPSILFTYEQVKQLYDIIQQQDPWKIQGFAQKTAELVAKLTPVFSLPPKEILHVKNLSPSDREIFLQMMVDLFEAGMYQRTWKGPGHPYIYRREDTSGSSLEQIECAMTPSFAKISHAQEMMSVEGRKILKVLPAVKRANPLEIYYYKLWEFLELTVQGQFCIGVGSSIMIETAVKYLEIFGRRMKDFDYDRFEWESTHRD